MPPTLLALPTEVKAVIMQMVAWQEDSRMLRKGYTTRKSRKAARAASGGGAGLGAVAMVCKDLNQIAAQFLFQTVSAPRMTPLFLHRISQRHSHLITHVEITPDFEIEHEDGGVTCDRALHLLPSFPNLRALTLDGDAARVLFGADWMTSGEAPGSDDIGWFRKEALKTVALSVDDLTLVSFETPEAARVLGLWSDLRRLRLTGLEVGMNEDTTCLGPIATELLRFKDLHHLELTGAAQSEESALNTVWPDATLSALILNPPPLTSLVLSFEPFGCTHFAFISSLHTSLQHLTISTDVVYPEHPGNPTPETFRVNLPFLTTLHIQNASTEFTEDATIKLLRPFLRSPITDLSISDDHASFQPDGESLTCLKGQLPELRRLTLDSHEACLLMSEFRAISAFCAERGLPPPTHSLVNDKAECAPCM
ncbi:hypothetical protein RQP46_000001 [Phenoliferia psychrophenolica]